MSVRTWRETFTGSRAMSKLARSFSNGNRESRNIRSVRFVKRAWHSRSTNSNRYCW